MENREGIKPESMNPGAGGTPPKSSEPTAGPPEDGVRAGEPPPPAPTGLADYDEPAFEQPPLFFNTYNMVMMGLMAALAAFLLLKFNLIELWAIVKAALRLSFVIFIHELGHFLAAKWCGVNVTTFSIGFGPPIPGCQFTWGDTNYRLAILPLGGYVQMVGQIDGDEGADDSDDPRSYRRKTVAQRMLIISAGVIMNGILAVICFITVYTGPGKEHPAAVVGWTDSGGPAFRNGLRTGAAITKIGDTEHPTFTDLMQAVINSLGGEKVPISYQLPGHKTVDTAIEPRKDTADTKPVLGLSPPKKLRLIQELEPRLGPYLAGTPAAAAKFQYGDVIIAMSDPDDPSKVTALRPDPRAKASPHSPDEDQCDYFEFANRLQLLADKEITVRVRRGTAPKTEEVDLKVARHYRYDLGVRMKMGPIAVVRVQSPAADAKVRGPAPDTKLEGDLIKAISVLNDDGKKLVWKDSNLEAGDKILDPERLPFELRQWSDRLDRAKFKGDRIVTLKLRRHKATAGNEQYKEESVDLKWDAGWRFERVAPFSRNSPMPIPELGLGYQIKAIVDEVRSKQSPLKVGDVIKNLRYDIEEFDENMPGKFMKKDLEENQWAYLSFIIFDQHHRYSKLILRIERDKKIEEIEIPLTVDKTWPIDDRGWLLASDTRRVRADGPLDAVWLGVKDTNNRMVEVFLNLRGMIFRRIDTENIGGPLTIAYGTYRFAGMDFADFVFFLGLISINLAVVNFLPIPVLDGGHMVFLIY
ncbi:MAG: site-2 protease family protein, partial [Planctomycetes bacterium]|nr:site-2 protease family protein [Planctomycetota bacterium]